MAQHYDNIPENFQPLSPWKYFWLTVLYGIPLLGQIFLIIHAIGAENINKKNYARSFFCVIILALIFIAVLFLIAGGSAGIGKISEALKS